MTTLDCDPVLQSIFDGKYGNFPLIDWKSWFSLSSAQDYESLALELSGLSCVENLSERMQHERTDPEALTVDVQTYVKFKKQKSPLIFCHTSGTSGGKMSDLKWYHFSDSLVSQLWVPGMQAIFESSGLDSDSSALIFIPSRNRGDGITRIDDFPVVKLYSAEFSQRLALSLINPQSYVLNEFKYYTTVQVLAHILSLDRLSVVSAPSSILLGWTNKDRLKNGLKKSMDAVPDDSEARELADEIHRKGMDKAVAAIQTRLSDILSDATFIFSTTSLSEKDWVQIREFLNWKKGSEKVTNLYVGSEVGPFAASISADKDTISRETMYVFPLTLPTMYRSSGFLPISRMEQGTNTLFVSRMHEQYPLININTGDVITLKEFEGLPVIGTEILRSPFPLKMQVSVSPEAGISPENLYVGEYFDFNDFFIKNPRELVTCMTDACNLDRSASLLMVNREGGWEIIVPSSHSKRDVLSCLESCPEGIALSRAIHDHRLHLKIIEGNPVIPPISRPELIQGVRAGELPKGILKRWPLYVKYQ